MKLLPQRGGGGSNGSNWEELNKMVFSSSQEPEMEMMQYLYYNIIVICRVELHFTTICGCASEPSLQSLAYESIVRITTRIDFEELVKDM